MVGALGRVTANVCGVRVYGSLFPAAARITIRLPLQEMPSLGVRENFTESAYAVSRRETFAAARAKAADVELVRGLA